MGWNGGGGDSNQAMPCLAEVQLRLCERGAGRSYRPTYLLLACRCASLITEAEKGKRGEEEDV